MWAGIILWFSTKQRIINEYITWYKMKSEELKKHFILDKYNVCDNKIIMYDK